MSNKSDEYQTPRKYVEAARLVMGTIDLDPASSAINSKRLQISSHYTKENSAFESKWFGNVWLNPPYSKPNLTKFTNQVINSYVVRSEIDQLIYLIPSSTSEKWYQSCLKYASAICLPDHRIDFLLNGVYQTAPRMSNTFFYFGKYSVLQMKFCEIFKQFGFTHLI